MVAAFAASPVATVSSGADFTLHGAKIVTAGIPSWPVLAGDNILAGTAAARIRFQDGSVVTLSPASSAAVEQGDNGLLLRLLYGSMVFTVAPNSNLSLFSGQTALAVTPDAETTVTAPGGALPGGNRGTPLQAPPHVGVPGPLPLSRK
jgi:ferric-dicitrate binding protein FerR (iron transport regulator)